MAYFAVVICILWTTSTSNAVANHGSDSTQNDLARIDAMLEDLRTELNSIIKTCRGKGELCGIFYFIISKNKKIRAHTYPNGDCFLLMPLVNV